MRELELDGIHDDDEHVILVDSEGGRYTLAIDEALRAAVRRDRPALGAIRATEATPLRPREIQAMLRQGRSAEEIAEIAKVGLEHVRRYEGPVLAERAYTAQRCRSFPVGRGDGPTLGEIVSERLAARRAEDDARWDAWRRQDGTWELELVFTAGGRERSAHWVADLDRRSIVAEDDEARWLVDEDPAAPEPGAGRARLTAIKRSVYDIEADGSFEDPGPRSRPRPLAWRAREDSARPEGGHPAMPEPHEAARRQEARRDHPAAIDAAELDALNARRGLRSVPSPAGVGAAGAEEPEEPVWEDLVAPAEEETAEAAGAEDPGGRPVTGPAEQGRGTASAAQAPADEEARAEHDRELAESAALPNPAEEIAARGEAAIEPTAWSEDVAEDTPVGDPSRERPRSAGTEDADSPAGPRPDAGENDTVELTPLPGMGDGTSAASEEAPTPARRGAKKRSGSKRSSIPSWDEIVFGSKHD